MKIELPEPSSEIIAAIAAKADPSGFIELPDFIETALYHPTCGYYRRDRQRVGKNAKSDFYTSTSLRDAFADIVIEATLALLDQTGLTAAETTWIEIGAEAGSTLLEHSNSPFKSIQTIGVADALSIPPEAVVFSNELFDAQPFRQIRFDGGEWHEFGIRLDGHQFRWCPRPSLSQEVSDYSDQLPTDLPAGYTIDLPTGSAKLARSIIKRQWFGVFIAFDYGKTWHNIIHDTPQGSARAYYKHQQLPEILEAPGEIDITHHICWDHLESELSRSGFQELCLQSQESFIVRRAPQFLQRAFDPRLPAFAPIRQKLKELMHPAMMGQKFQALSAIRPHASQH